jgi:hypothetical protein
MINPLRRLVYEILVQPIISVTRGVVDLTKNALHRLPLHSPRVMERKAYLWRWQNDMPPPPRRTE